MKLRKIAAAAAAAAIAASAFSVQGFAAGKKMELLTAPLSEIDGADGISDIMYPDNLYFTFANDENGDYITGFLSVTDENIDSWRESGEFSYNEVKADGIDLSNRNITIFTDSPQIAYRDENGNFTKRLAYSFNGTDEMALTHESDEWFFARDDGYRVQIGRNSANTVCMYVTAPDGTEYCYEINRKGDILYYSCLESRQSDKYVAYLIYATEQELNHYDEEYGNVYDLSLNIELIDKEGEATLVDSIDVQQGVYDFGNGIFKINHSVYSMPTFYMIDFETAELVDVSGFYHSYSLSGYEDIYGNVMIGRYNGDEGGYSYRLLSLEDGGYFLSDRFFKSLSTGDNGKKFLVQTQDGKWGYLNSKGKLLATFDGAGWFIGDYAPVVENGKAYLIDRSMNRVSEKIDAEGVCTLGANLFLVTIDGEDYLMTYVPDESADEEPIDDNTDVDVEEPDDNTDVEEPDDNTDVILDESTDSESTPAESADAGENTDNTDAGENTDNADAADTAVENPNTGAGSIAAIGAVLISAAGALVLSRKHR